MDYVQLFVKNSKWKSEYWLWRNISTALPTGTWSQVSMTPSNPIGNNAYMRPGFNLTDIIMIGIKVGRGGGPTNTFTGNFYLDEVSFNINPWETSTADYKFDFEDLTLELQATKSFDQHIPYWNIDPAWSAEACGTQNITIEEIDGNKVLAIATTFTLTTEIRWEKTSQLVAI